MSLSVSCFNGFSIFSQRFGTNGILNATQDKMERQQKAQGQIDFLEKQKENLKNMQCDNIEDIAKKLEISAIFILKADESNLKGFIPVQIGFRSFYPKIIKKVTIYEKRSKKRVIF